VIERDALMFPETIREGAKAPRLKTSLLSPAYRIRCRSPRGINREERTGDLCVNSANPHAAGDLARGVKDLLVQSRWKSVTETRGKRPALEQSNAH
jgi:hypothetical protein